MFWQNAREFIADSSGSAFVYVGLLMFAIAGFAGLSIDVSHWYVTQRGAQSAADSAAVAGAYEAMWGGDTAAVQAAAEAQAEKNGFAASTVTVNPGYGAPGEVEVIIRQPTAGFFSSLVMADNSVDIAARSVAGQVAGVPACLLMTEPYEEDAIALSGGSHIGATGCGLHANSDNARAIDASGGTVTAESVTTSGDFKAGSEENITGETESGVQPLGDPLSFMVPPTVGPCSPGHESQTKVNGGATETFEPGVYCGGIVGTGGSTIIFRAGFYVIKDGPLKSGGGGTLKIHDDDLAAGRGVSFYLTGDDALIEVTGGGQVTLRADNEGPMPGILFWADAENAPNDKKAINVFSGGTDTVYEGTIYLPNQDIKYTGGSTVDVASMGALIARSILASGGGVLTMDSGLTGSGGAVSAALGGRSIAVLE